MRVFGILAAAVIALHPIPAMAEVDISAKAALVLDPSGRVLYSRNATQKLPPASTTKVLTVLVALEEAGLNEVVKISRHAASIPPSSIDLKRGEFFTVRELLYASLLKSANDACVALAEHISGSEAKFGELMTRKARALGCKNSQFVNPHGLPAEGHYTTAEDLSLILRAAMANPTFVRIATTQRIQLSWKGHHAPRMIINKNKLLTGYDLPVIGKTGWTVASKHCYVGTTYGQQPVLIAMLGSKQLWPDARRLLDFGMDRVVNSTIPHPQADSQSAAR